jgi:hypothetical protein
VTAIPAFTEDQWLKTLARLIVYAQGKFRRLGWYHDGKFISPMGHKPKEIATEAIVRVIEGKRVYNAEKCPDFHQFLRWVVRSIISSIVTSSDFKRREPPPSFIAGEGENNEIELEGKELEPFQIYATKELAEKMKLLLQKKFSEDKLVCDLIDCLSAGIDKASEIAEYLEVDVKEIYNARRNLQREVEKNFQKFKLEYQK